MIRARLTLLKTILIFKVLFISNVHAFDGISATGNGGISFGGDRLQTVTFEDENGNNFTEDLSAGELFFLNFGSLWHLNEDFKLVTTLGWHYDQINIDPGNVDFSRFPLEFIPFFYPAENHRFGFGLTYHIAPRLDTTDSGGSETKFEDALGLVFEYDTQIGANFYFGIRFVQIEYETETTGQVFDGNYIGILIGEGF